MQCSLHLARDPSNLCTPPEGDVGGSTRRLIRPHSEKILSTSPRWKTSGLWRCRSSPSAGGPLDPPAGYRSQP
eukprot:6252082-Pyramimonas_sp.AAC.2